MDASLDESTQEGRDNISRLLDGIDACNQVYRDGIARLTAAMVEKGHDPVQIKKLTDLYAWQVSQDTGGAPSPTVR